MTDVSVVLVTVGNMEAASSIGRTLVEERLVACVNIIPRIHSIYWWKGEICTDEEVLLVMKTRSSLFPDLRTRVRELHSYEVPEIVAFPLEQGLPEYLKWVVEETSRP
jgi:periplasmic divalent cation tolerance protein